MDSSKENGSLNNEPNVNFNQNTGFNEQASQNVIPNSNVIGNQEQSNINEGMNNNFVAQPENNAIGFQNEPTFANQNMVNNSVEAPVIDPFVNNQNASFANQNNVISQENVSNINEGVNNNFVAQPENNETIFQNEPTFANQNMVNNSVEVPVIDPFVNNQNASFANQNNVIPQENVSNGFQANNLSNSVNTDLNSFPNNQNIINNELAGESNLNNQPKKKMNKLFIIIPTVIALLGIIALLVFRLYFNNPYNLMTTAFETMSAKYEDVANTVLIDYDLYEDKVQMDIDATLNVLSDSTGTLNDYNGLSVAISLGMDYKNNNIVVGSSVNDDTTSIIDIKAEYLNELLYVDLGDVYDSALYTNLEESIDFSELLNDSYASDFDSVDFTKIVEEVLNSYLEILDKENTDVEKVTIDYFGDDKEVTKTTFIYDQDAYDRLIDCLVDSETLITYLSEASGYSIEEIKTMLEDGELFEYQSGDLDFNVYTSGILNTCVGYSISKDEYIMVLADGNEGQIILKEIYDGENIVIEYTNEDDIISYNFSLGDDIQNINGTISENKFTVNADIEGFNFGLIYQITDSSSTSASEKLTLSLKYSDDDGDIDVELVLNTKMQVVESLTGIDNTNAVDMNYLTTDELNEIIDNLNASVEGTVLEDIISSYTNSYSDDYYVDYNYGSDYSSDLFVSDADEILSAVKTLVLADEIMGIDTTCYTITDLYYDGYISSDIYMDYYAKIEVDKSSSIYTYTLYLYDNTNDKVISGVTYSSYDSVSEYDITNYVYSSEYYSCN